MKNQVFQTDSKWRWRTFQWTSRLTIVIIALMIPVIIFTLYKGIQPNLPLLVGDTDSVHHLANPIVPAGLTRKELKKYKGFNDFLLAKSKIEILKNQRPAKTTEQVRAAFYVDWDPQSFFSLQRNIDKLNMVIPEWFFIDPTADTLTSQIDLQALNLMKKNNVKILPILNNINRNKGAGEFDGAIIHRIINNPAKKEKLISDILKYLRLYNLQGINIDFEDFIEKGDEPIIAFQRDLYNQLHSKGYLVTQDILPRNEDFNIRQLAAYNDYMFLMAYDEHYGESVAGPISSQKWIEKVLDETTAEVSSQKIILCIAGYGYDWPRKYRGHFGDLSAGYCQCEAT